jgi:hypothetical protein
VGSVGISSAGQGRIAIEVAGLPSPQRIKTIIDERRAAARRARVIPAAGTSAGTVLRPPPSRAVLQNIPPTTICSRRGW